MVVFFLIPTMVDRVGELHIDLSVLVAQVVEHLLSKCEALSSNPSTASDKSAYLAGMRPSVQTSMLPKK
jgi:hypothetical protein